MIGGKLFDLRNGQQLRPPAGHKFHPDLSRLAPDGRFVWAGLDSETVLIDTKTGKYFPISERWIGLPPSHNLPGFGIVTACGGNKAKVRILPSANRLAMPASLLELWAQVIVRGELGTDGEFVKWDERTWERKRQELAAAPAPHPELPFPGHVARDRLHWLRSEQTEAKTDRDNLRLVTELLRRAESNGDSAEVVRWRAEKKRLGLVAPPTR